MNLVLQCDYAHFMPRRVSVLPAITMHGIIWAATVIGSFSGSTFLQFLDGLLTQMNPYPQPRSVLVMDNCAIHHIEEVEIRCRNRSVPLFHSPSLPESDYPSGIRLVYLPPYSPDYNPIEEMFSAFKAHIRRHHRDFRTILRSKSHYHLVTFLYNALYRVSTPDACSGWFRKYIPR
jgi:transposase